MAYLKDMEPYGTIGDEWDGPIPAVYSLPTVPVGYAKDYCPGCGEIVAAGEPCECVFVARGWVDAQGVLHTARREPLDGEHVLDDWLGWRDEEFEAGLGAQIDAWRDAGASWDEVEALLSQAR